MYVLIQGISYLQSKFRWNMWSRYSVKKYKYT